MREALIVIIPLYHTNQTYPPTSLSKENSCACPKLLERKLGQFTVRIDR